ncbi:MAG: N(G),N(G)-dimethylarginine dimethylaminohydrolase [Myxococcales bacterium]|nr:N(G),N(G)-dimethylarginine dimethylaminohydrolase [Myxococcales bacterium]
MSRFTRALVRLPASTFAQGLTEAGLGPPDLELALAQHAAYCEALASAGLEVIRLPPAPEFPDSTFVEDAAILTPRGAILTRPGAPSRAGEVEGIAAALSALGVDALRLEGPGHVDGGDVCEAEGEVLIGLSSRTDPAGAEALTRALAGLGMPATTIDVRGRGPALLHLKTGLAYVGEGRVVVVQELADEPALAAYERIVVGPAEAHAANCVRVGDRVLMPTGAPRLVDALIALGLAVQLLEISEFRKMDGGLSCLSLRWPEGLAGG